MKKSILFISILVMTSIAASAQVKVGNNPTTINGSAVLEMESTTKGMLLPRMTTAERTAIATPAAGLQVYDTTENANYFFDGTAWQKTASGDQVWKKAVSAISAQSGILATEPLVANDSVFIANNGRFYQIKARPAGYVPSTIVGVEGTNINDNTVVSAGYNSTFYTNTSDNIDRAGLFKTIGLDGTLSNTVLGWEGLALSHPSTTGNFSFIRASSGVASHYGSGNVTNLIGHEGVAIVRNGSATNVWGGRFTSWIDNNTSVSNELTGVSSTLIINPGTNVATSMIGYDLKIINNTPGNIITPLAYGLRIAPITSGTKNFAIRTNAGLVSFGDAVELIGGSKSIQAADATTGLPQTLNLNPNNGNVNIGGNVLAISTQQTGDRAAAIDFQSSNVGSGYSTRLIRGNGVNGNFTLANLGTGNIIIGALDIPGQEFIMNGVTGFIGMGIAGTATPLSPLHIGAGGNATVANVPTLRLSEIKIEGVSKSGIGFGIETVDNNRVKAGITFNSVGATSGRGDLTFHVSNVNANENIYATNASLDASERLRITMNGDIIHKGTGYLKIATGTDAQRPAAPVAGMIRFNTTTVKFEGYDGTAWVNLN
jgi:hypothetical protein